MSKGTGSVTERDSIDAFLERALEVFPDLDPQVEAIVDRVWHLHKHLDRLSDAGARRFELHRGEFKVLLKLRQVLGERLSPGDLSELLALSSGAMTNRLDRLEEAGLVVRERDPKDRRGVSVAITDRGRAVTDDAVREIAKEEQRALGTLSSAEQAKLNDLLRKVILGFEQG
jgi:DNA-binding MarR family transcriptional regulator